MTINGTENCNKVSKSLENKEMKNLLKKNISGFVIEYSEKFILIISNLQLLK